MIICIEAIVLNAYHQERNCHDLITITTVHLCVSRWQLLCQTYCCIALDSLLHPLPHVCLLHISYNDHINVYTPKQRAKKLAVCWGPPGGGPPFHGTIGTMVNPALIIGSLPLRRRFQGVVNSFHPR